MNHDKPLSLYVVVRGDDKERLRPLIRLILAMTTRKLMGV
jgi:type IV secretion system protein VirD4